MLQRSVVFAGTLSVFPPHCERTAKTKMTLVFR